MNFSINYRTFEMKKVILLLSITAALLTSCLGETSRNYSERSVVYIAEEGFVTYGRTLSGRFITFPQINIQEPGSLKLISYSWTEEDGTSPVGLDYPADNVTVSGEIEDIRRAYLSLSEPQDESDKILNLQLVNQDFEQFMGDFWIFEYRFTGKDGIVNFFLDSEESSFESDRAVIKVHFDITEESSSDSYGIVALELSQLRSMLEGVSTTNTKRVQVRLVDFNSGNTIKDIQFLVAGD